MGKRGGILTILYDSSVMARSTVSYGWTLEMSELRSQKTKGFGDRELRWCFLSLELALRGLRVLGRHVAASSRYVG